MNKTRYRLTLAILALAASPIALLTFMFGAYLVRAVEYPELFSVDKFTHLFRPIDILNWLPTAYAMGLFPTLFVLLAIHKSTRREGKFRTGRIYLMSLLLATLPFIALTLMTGRVQGLALVLTTAIAASVSFFVLLPIGKKLLRWAGVPLPESTKAGTP